MPTLVVTGAGRGLGLEFARQYATHGWKVIATCRDEAAAASLRELPGNVSVEFLDVRDHEGLVAFPKRSGGDPIDLFIANAGMTKPDGFGSAADADGWVEVLDAGEVYAPFGFDDLLGGVLRPNPNNIRPDHMLAKARDYRARWPWLRIG